MSKQNASERGVYTAPKGDDYAMTFILRDGKPILILHEGAALNGENIDDVLLFLNSHDALMAVAECCAADGPHNTESEFERVLRKHGWNGEEHPQRFYHRLAHEALATKGA